MGISQAVRGHSRIALVALLALIVGLVAVFQVLPPPPVFAHANLARAEPSPNSVLDLPPSRVIIWFTEPLEPDFSAIRVLDSQGTRVDRGDSIVDRTDPTVMSVSLNSLANGTYTVAWNNVSTVDSHRVRGSFVFSVGEPLTGGLPPGETLEQPLLQSPLEPLFRWLGLLGILAIVGGLGFQLLVTRPVLAHANAGENLRLLGVRLASRMSRLLWLAVGLVLVASLGQLVIQTAAVYDTPLHQTVGSPIASVITGTEWGNLWLWRIVLLLAMAAVLGLGYLAPRQGHGSNRASPELPPSVQVSALGLGAGILLTLSLTSHGAATPEIRFAAVFSDYLHLLAASFWVGGLFHLALAAPVVTRALPAAEVRGVLSALVPRFSTLAILSVGTLTITGVYSGWAQVTIPAAIATPYGWTLLGKLALIVPLLSLGALNLLWISPRLAKEQRAGRLLRWFVTGEALLALMVLLAVGVLTSLEPARQVASREGIGQEDRLTFQDSVEGADITLEIEPGRVGLNQFTVSLKDRLGRPITNATDVTLGLNYLDAELGESAEVAAPAGAGNYVLEEGLLSVAGLWQVELVVRRPDAFDARTAFRFEAPSGVAGSAVIAPSASTGWLLFGLELALLGFLFLAVGVPLGGWRTRRGAAVMGPGMACALVGILLVFNAQLGWTDTAANLRNPFPPNAASLEAGQQVYTQNCQMCHGPGGRGDGPLAAGLTPPPLDLVVHVPLHRDGDLFQFISDGISGTAMPPFEGKLTEDEIWHVINYIKTFEE